MAIVYALTYCVLGLVAMHASLVVWAALVLPAPVARARARIEIKPVASFFAGLALIVLTVLAYLVFHLFLDDWTNVVAWTVQRVTATLHLPRFHNDEYIFANCAAWPVLGAPAMVGWIVGGAGLAQIFAHRARALMHQDRPLLALSLGAVTQSLACFLPAVGWFIFLPVTAAISVGAGLLAIVRPRAVPGPYVAPGGKSTALKAEPYESELASS